MRPDAVGTPVLSVECCNWIFPQNVTWWWIVTNLEKFKLYDHLLMSKNGPTYYQNLFPPTSLLTTYEQPVKLSSDSAETKRGQFVSKSTQELD